MARMKSTIICIGGYSVLKGCVLAASYITRGWMVWALFLDLRIVGSDSRTVALKAENCKARPGIRSFQAILRQKTLERQENG